MEFKPMSRGKLHGHGPAHSLTPWSFLCDSVCVCVGGVTHALLNSLLTLAGGKHKDLLSCLLSTCSSPSFLTLFLPLVSRMLACPFSPHPPCVLLVCQFFPLCSYFFYRPYLYRSPSLTRLLLTSYSTVFFLSALSLSPFLDLSSIASWANCPAPTLKGDSSLSSTAAVEAAATGCDAFPRKARISYGSSIPTSLAFPKCKHMQADVHHMYKTALTRSYSLRLTSACSFVLFLSTF